MASPLTGGSAGTMHRPFGVIALALSLGLWTGGCARATQGGEERETVYEAEKVFTVRVVNRSRLDATIFLVHDGSRDRLGTVTAANTAVFTIRARTLGSGEFALLADPVGDPRTASTESLRVAQGTVFTWTLETDFSRGAVLVQE
jgi:hypothetical protein